MTKKIDNQTGMVILCGLPGSGLTKIKGWVGFESGSPYSGKCSTGSMERDLSRNPKTGNRKKIVGIQWEDSYQGSLQSNDIPTL